MVFNLSDLMEAGKLVAQANGDICRECQWHIISAAEGFQRKAAICPLCLVIYAIDPVFTRPAWERTDAEIKQMFESIETLTGLSFGLTYDRNGSITGWNETGLLKQINDRWKADHPERISTRDELITWLRGRGL